MHHLVMLPADAASQCEVLESDMAGRQFRITAQDVGEPVIGQHLRIGADQGDARLGHRLGP